MALDGYNETQKIANPTISQIAIDKENWRQVTRRFATIVIRVISYPLQVCL
jgi:hypothetical protein